MAWIDCPPGAIPAAGQYCAGYSLGNPDEILPTVLFPSGYAMGGFLTAPGIPRNWEPGSELVLHGPIGNGFKVPADARRVGLIACGSSIARVLPVAEQGLGSGADVALFSNGTLASLPAAVEVQPLNEAGEAHSWADFLAIEIALDALDTLGTILGLAPGERLACPGQVLVLASMPCCGLGECGVCAVAMRRGWKLACKDGPVFDVKDLGDR